MQWYGILGAGLVAWSPLAAVLLLYMQAHPQLVMIGVASCFFFVLAMHFCALFWLIVAPMKDNASFHAAFGAVFVEVFRYLFYRIYAAVEKAFGKRFGEVVYFTEFSVVPAALAAGVGWAASQSLLSFGVVFAYHTDETVTSADATWIDDDVCSGYPMLFFHAFQSMLFNICNVAWMVLAFIAYYSLSFPEDESDQLPFNKMGRPCSPTLAKGFLFSAIGLHIGASLFTNIAITGSCRVTLPLVALFMVISVTCAYYASKLTYKKKPDPPSETPANATRPDDSPQPPSPQAAVAEPALSAKSSNNAQTPVSAQAPVPQHDSEVGLLGGADDEELTLAD
ncbi:Gamma-secretase subunit Aph-1 [Diplonema papillatum]|nr:Gamma-secretase subunit Aph-1 [Diplonema papillatum]